MIFNAIDGQNSGEVDPTKLLFTQSLPHIQVVHNPSRECVLIDTTARTQTDCRIESEILADSESPLLLESK